MIKPKTKKNKPICIIPIRKGSKTVKNKNIKKINGKPLIYYTLKTTLSSNLFKKIIIASDSNKYFKIVSKYFQTNKIIFFKRSSKSARDSAKTEIVINEILRKHKDLSDFIFLVQATSPLLNKYDFIQSFKKFKSNNFDSMFSCYKIKRFIWKKNNKKIIPINYDFKNRPMKQNTDFVFIENGGIYIFKKKVFLKFKNRLGGKIGFFEIPEERSLDIDSKKDFDLAKNIL